jgi:hypothetical protein
MFGLGSFGTPSLDSLTTLISNQGLAVGIAGLAENGLQGGGTATLGVIAPLLMNGMIPTHQPLQLDSGSTSTPMMEATPFTTASAPVPTVPGVRPLSFAWKSVPTTTPSGLKPLSFASKPRQ